MDNQVEDKLCDLYDTYVQVLILAMSNIWVNMHKKLEVL